MTPIQEFGPELSRPINIIVPLHSKSILKNMFQPNKIIQTEESSSPDSNESVGEEPEDQFNGRKQNPYPNNADDPDPLPSNASETMITAYRTDQSSRIYPWYI